jgi:hypothetical protein
MNVVWQKNVKLPGLGLDSAVIFKVSIPRLKYHEIFLEFYRVANKLNLRPSNLQLMPWNFQIQLSKYIDTLNITALSNPKPGIKSNYIRMFSLLFLYNLRCSDHL